MNQPIVPQRVRCIAMLLAVLAHGLLLRGVFAESGVWRQRGFDDFSKGTFGNGGQNLYVSKAGVLQRIFQFDLNRDGFLDLVICNSHGKDEQPPLYVYPYALAEPDHRVEIPGDGAVSGDVADLNGDGHDDLVIAMADNGARTDLNSYIYFGSPEGFSERQLVLLPTPGVLSTAAGDFNGDGKQDVAFQLPGMVRVFYQNELGFEAKRYKELAIDGESLSADQLFNHAISDLVVRSANGDVAVYAGGKEGLAATARVTVSALNPIPKREKTVYAAFLETRDEAYPLATVLHTNNAPHLFVPEPDRIRLIPVQTNGSLGKAIELDCPKALAASAGDVDGDGYTDLVVGTRQTNGDEEQSWIYWGSRIGVSSVNPTPLATRRACDVVVVDLDGDGCDEVVFCQYLTDESYSSKSAVYRGSKEHKFAAPTELKSADARRVLVARSAADRAPQLVFVNRMQGDRVGNPDVSIFWGDKSGFAPDRKFDVAGWGALESVPADLNDDGRPDLVLSNCAEDTIWRDPGSFVFLSGEQGIKHKPTLKLPTTRSQGMACGDINRDGILDLISCGFENPNITIFLGNAEGWDQPRRIRLEYRGELYKDVNWVYLADLNADGWLDLVAPMITKDRSFIFWGGPDGFSMANVKPLAAERAACARAADFLGSGRLDLILGGHNVKVGLPHDSFAYLFWNGPEGFRQDRRMQLPAAGANSISVADFNNDGTLDFYVGSYHAGLARDTDSYIYWNRKGRGFSARDRQRLFTHSASGSLAADFNEDGWVDLATAYHKVDGRHIGWSAVWWNGPDGFDEKRITKLPSIGPHGITCIAPANQRDGGPEEFYESSPFEMPASARSTAIDWKADVPAKTWLKAQVRTADSEKQLAEAAWTGPTGDGTWFTAPQKISKTPKGRWIQYRLALGATNGVASPRVTEVAIAFADGGNASAKRRDAFKPLEIVERKKSNDRPAIHEAYYTRPKGIEMLGQGGLSESGGRTWKPFKPTPDFAANLPHGYRRESFPAVCDPHSGRIVLAYNALDTPGLDPNIIEPPAALRNYYLRYRVSIDAGRTWLFDETVIQKGHTEEQPFDGVSKGKNSIFFGDVGSEPIFTSRKELLVPVQICPLGPDGKLFNPSGGTTYTETGVLIGSWTKENRIQWDISERVVGEIARTPRGLFEPTLAELPDGRILMIMRGSNRGKKTDPKVPGHKWISVSDDRGRTWTKPEPWKYSNGESFFSPSSMSQLFTHSSGRIFWLGNITPENSNGNSPRWPLVIGEVDPETLRLVKSSIVELDTRRPDDPPRVDISHFRAIEDQKTGEIIVTAPRALNGYKSTTWTTSRLKAVEKPSASLRD